MKPGQTVEAGGYSVRFDGMKPATGPNYSEERGHFSIGRGGVEVADVWSSKRIYAARQMPTTEAGILTFGLSQLYMSLGDPTDDGGIVVRIWWKPFILCIWGGAVIMAIGGFVSLSDRRLRVRRSAPESKADEARGSGSGGGGMTGAPSLSLLCLSQGSSAPKSFGAEDTFVDKVSFMARTHHGWIPVTGTGMRGGRASAHQAGVALCLRASRCSFYSRRAADRLCRQSG